MGLVVFWEHWDASSIPSPAQWVKDPGHCHSCDLGLDCGSDLILAEEFHMPQEGQKKGKKKKKTEKAKET